MFVFFCYAVPLLDIFRRLTLLLYTIIKSKCYRKIVYISCNHLILIVYYVYFTIVTDKITYYMLPMQVLLYIVIFNIQMSIWYTPQYYIV